MKLRDLKNILNKMDNKQLNKPLIYKSDCYSLSGVVAKVGKAKANLYYTGEDDPAKLYTRKQLKENFDNDAIEEFELEIPKGALVIEF